MLPFHPLADLFPLTEGKDFDEMCASVLDDGLGNAIVIYEGKILDGRNRARACDKSGVEPRYEQFTGDDPLAFVMAANYHRRHLSPSQRAIVLAEFTKLHAGRPRKIRETPMDFTDNTQTGSTPRQNCTFSAEDAAKAAGVSKRTMQAARKVSESGSAATIKKVKAGKKSVSEAASEIREKEKKSEAKEKTPAQQLRAKADDFASEINRITHQLDALIAWADDDARKQAPIGKQVHWFTVVENLRLTRKHLHQGRRSKTCPYCKGDGIDKKKTCKGCDGTGSVTAATYASGCEAVGTPEEVVA